jgi:hypothetical protein
MAVGGEEAIGGEGMKVRVEGQIIAKSVDGGDGSDAAIGEIIPIKGLSLFTSPFLLLFNRAFEKMNTFSLHL